MKRSTITPLFVELIPRKILDGVLYISEEHRTATHNCCCGCGMKVVTSLSPARWKLHREGSLVSLYPSIGNWDFPCRSHYWIRRNQIVWAGAMTSKTVQRVKERDQRDIKRYIAENNALKKRDAVRHTESDDTWYKSLQIWIKTWF